jgi:AcrR family transcriptional regulator
MPHLHPNDETRHDVVLDAAIRLFSANGFAGTAVPEVAKAARVGLGTLYRYYPSKLDLVNGAYRHCKRQLQHVLIHEFPWHASLRDQFHALWLRLYDFASRDPEGFAFLELHHHEPYLDTESRAVEFEVLAPIAAFYLQGQAAGAIGALPAPIGISMIWGAFVGLVKSERAGYLTITDDVLIEAENAAWKTISKES